MTETAPGFPRFKDDGSTPPHPRGCPCNPCRGRRNRRSGKAKQAAARKAFEAQTGTQARWRGLLANEETFNHLPVRIEVKSGAQCGPAWTRFLAAEAQSDQAHALGGTKPFLAVLMAKDTSDGLVCFRLSQLERVVEALAS